MTAIEVGSFFWFVGFAVLAFMGLFLFYLAPKEGSEKWIQWKKLLGIIIFLNQAFYWVSSISDGTFTLQESLPLHMCGFSQLMLFAFLAFDVRKVFPILVFWGPLGGIQAFLTPALSSEPTWPYILQFYLAHSFVVLVPIYLMARGGERLPSGTFWRTILITNIAGFIMMAINAALGSNYWYVNQPPPVNHPLVQGEWPFYLMGMEAAVVVLFFLFSLAFRSFKEVK